MARDLQLKITGNAGTIAFTFDGEWDHSVEIAEWKEAAEPPIVRRRVEKLVVRNAKLIAATQSSLWSSWATLQSYLEHGGGATDSALQLSYAQIVRDPTNANSVVRAIGNTTGSTATKRFRVLRLDSHGDPDHDAASWLSSIGMDLELQAEQLFPDDNGIVGFQQSYSESADGDGLTVIELRTVLSTIPGVDARTKVRTYGAIDIDAYGDTYSWETNNSYGVNVDTDDADETGSWVPTRAVGTSRIKQSGISVGSNEPGNAVAPPSYSVQTIEEEGKTTTITRAQATGPGHVAWVLGKKPSGATDKTDTLHEYAQRRSEASWTQVKKPTDADPLGWEIQLQITGGSQDEEFVALAANRLPELVVGPFRHYELEVSITMKFVGAEADTKLMPFPAVLPAPWRLQKNRSKADAWPRLTKRAKPGNESQQEWTRTASLVYTSRTTPDVAPLKDIYAVGAPVEHYHLGAL